MTFSIKKIIWTELFIDRATALFHGEILIKENTNEGDQRVDTS